MKRHPLALLARPLTLGALLLAGAPASADAPTPAAPAPAAPGASVQPSTPQNARTLAVAVRSAIEDAEDDLGKMPFFVRPMARSGFSRRTGMSFDDWKKNLGPIMKDDTPASIRSRWPQVDSVLAKLVDNFRTAPERAKRGMGDNPELMKMVVERSQARAAAAQAMLDWMRR